MAIDLLPRSARLVVSIRENTWGLQADGCAPSHPDGVALPTDGMPRRGIGT